VWYKLCVTAKEFQKLVTGDESDFLDRFLALLKDLKADFCIIGGLAVNAYTEPVVTLDCDVVVVTARLPELERELGKQFRVERFEHSLNVSDKGSDVRIQIQTDPRYQGFGARSREAEVLGRKLPVACAADVLAGKLWAYQDTTRRRSKREKDRLDILRLVEAQPELAGQVPEDLRKQLL
jgi:hypothetical protein